MGLIFLKYISDAFEELYNKLKEGKGEYEGAEFIDARNMGHLVNRRTRELSDDDIQKIAQTYHNWKNSPPLEGARGGYKDVQCFCKSATLSEVRAMNYALTPGRYVGLAEEEDVSILPNALLRLKRNWKNR
jgi:type I restriction enzyme M protein